MHKTSLQDITLAYERSHQPVLEVKDELETHNTSIQPVSTSVVYCCNFNPIQCFRCIASNVLSCDRKASNTLNDVP